MSKLPKIILSLVVVFTIFKSTTSLSCYKCYRVEDCPLKNCSAFYGLLDTTYRDHFLLEKDQTLPLCPQNISDDSLWRKLEVDGTCGRGSLWNQPCAVSDFQVSGVSLKKTTLHGVFLGCPRETLVGSLLKPASGPIKRSYRCVTRRTETIDYEDGIVDGRHRFVDLRLALTLCTSNCSLTPWKCNICFGDGCISSNNTLIRRLDDDVDTDRLINWALLALAVIVVLTFLLATYCGMERIGRLDLIISEDGTIYAYQSLITGMESKVN